jgi:hypothetical protein
MRMSVVRPGTRWSPWQLTNGALAGARPQVDELLLEVLPDIVERLRKAAAGELLVLLEEVLGRGTSKEDLLLDAGVSGVALEYSQPVLAVAHLGAHTGLLGVLGEVPGVEPDVLEDWIAVEVRLLARADSDEEATACGRVLLELLGVFLATLLLCLEAAEVGENNRLLGELEVGEVRRGRGVEITSRGSRSGGRLKLGGENGGEQRADLCVLDATLVLLTDLGVQLSGVLVDVDGDGGL